MAGAAVRNHPSTRAGGQDDVSSKQTPSNEPPPVRPSIGFLGCKQPMADWWKVLRVPKPRKLLKTLLQKKVFCCRPPNVMSAAEPGRMIEPIPRKRKANQRQQPWLWTLQIIWNRCVRKRRRTLEFKEEAPSTWTDFLQTDPGPYTWVGNRIQKQIVCKWGWISSFNIMLQACRANVTNASDVVSDYYRLWFLSHTTGSRQFHVGAICKPPNSISNPKNDQQRGTTHNQIQS